MQSFTDQNSRIEEAAYKLYVQRGRVDGNDLNDWFEAEKLTKGQSSSNPAKVVSKPKTAALKSDKRRKKESK